MRNEKQCKVIFDNNYFDNKAFHLCYTHDGKEWETQSTFIVKDKHFVSIDLMLDLSQFVNLGYQFMGVSEK